MQQKVFSFLLAIAAVALLGSNASAQQKFTVNLNTIQEVPPTNTNGRGRCMVTLNLAQTQITDVTCEFDGLSSGVISGHIHGPAAPGANAGILFDLTPPTGVTSGTFTRGPFTLTPTQLADLRAKRLYVNIHTTVFQGGEIRGQIKIQTTPYDNDGDGRTDLKVYRSSTFTFHVLQSLNNSNIFSSALGLGFPNPAIPLNSASDDYDGDGRGDLVLVRASNSLIFWRILLTGSNTIRDVNWGRTDTEDDLVPADYDGDGRTDIAVYRYTTGIWYILQSLNNQPRYEFWGQPGANEYGMVGDFDRDGRNDLTTIRGTANGIGWFTRRSSDNAMQIAYWGNPATDSFVTWAQIDIDGDGIQDRMVYRDLNPPTQSPANNLGDRITFFILRSSDNGHFILQFGLDSDTFLFGDYDGDGRTDIVARRVINGQMVWFIYQSSNAQVRVVNWGITSDQLAGEDESESHLNTLPMLKRGK